MPSETYKPIPSLFLGIDVSPDRAEELKTKADDFMAMFNPAETFLGDSMFTCAKSLGFLKNDRFRQIVDRNSQLKIEQTIIWRTYVLCWAANSCLGLEGDFVECGAYMGYSARCVAEFVDFVNTDKQYYLYDVFENPPEAHAMRHHGAKLYDQVKERFADHPNVKVTRGLIPDILETVAPEKIAFMHIDMNSVSAEIGALEHLFDRVTPGGIIVFDDYGYGAYVAQKEAEDEFMAERGHMILELPTGQGLVLKG